MVKWSTCPAKQRMAKKLRQGFDINFCYTSNFVFIVNIIVLQAPVNATKMGFARHKSIT